MLAPVFPSCSLSESFTRTLFEKLELEVNRHGFDRFQLRLSVCNTADINNELVVSNYPESWRKIYDELGYSLVDPLVSHSTRNVTSVIWSKRLYSSPDQIKLWQLAQEYGLEYGVTFALHGPAGQKGIFSLNTLLPETQAIALIRERLGQLSLLRDEVLQAALSLAIPAANVSQINLTKREKEMLHWSANGKTSWEISNICGCTEDNVEFHFKNIRRKFGVTSRRAAVVHALSMRLI
ncbi:LuxR family transcriptional regulator [Pseudomonas sp. Irchel 3A7]|uniref:helix-turn-helix transcriptional regulator n=1 Tax=Pseudomonas sp. Irchel 3A7 TaxID=2008913 RepID=UPI000BA32880|nr:LuxR family transcriptional regulator [Pseudomonas sp. Irchel 3A7]